MEDPFRTFQSPSFDGLKNFLRRREKSRLVIAGVFLVLIGVTWFGYWYHHLSDPIFNVAPVDTILYATTKNPAASSVPTQLIIRAAATYVGLDQKNISDVALHADRMSIMLFPDDQYQRQWVVGFSIHDQWYLEQASKNFPHAKIIDHRILIVAADDSAIQKIADVRRGQLFSLASQTSSLQVSMHDAAVVFSLGNLKTVLEQMQSPIANMIDIVGAHNAVVLLDNKSDQWQFQITGANVDDVSRLPLPPKNVPADFQMYLTSPDVVASLAPLLATNAGGLHDLGQTITALSAAHQKVVDTVSASLLHSRASIISFGRGDNNALQYDFVVVFPAQPTSVIHDFKSVVQLVLAQKLPHRVSHRLPDKTSVIELVFDPALWQWRTATTSPAIISTITEPKLGFELGIATTPNHFIVASSINLLQHFLSSTTSATMAMPPCTNVGTNPPQFVLKGDAGLPSLKSVLAGATISAAADQHGHVIGCLY